ncbi:aldehyde dehydrogenase family protein [Nocardia panacis]|uniref:Aldehyde dehydrogenase family protein n=1 Tax=Nocardia panacis TaxID=2340916 RepID=A0A3A4K1R5_9NOCA|nr:aldehyde dehydrogenase family protein [Nocardia panacis]RJO70067.1 aldehyde dehydrogenase family protein [Nocardia panacis]
MPAVSAPPRRLDALGAGGAFRSRRVEEITDVTGRIIAELSLVPWVYAQRAIKALRLSEAPTPQRRRELLAEAGRLFTDGTVDGMSAHVFHRTVAAVSGMPITAVRAATRSVGEFAALAMESADKARPVGAVADWRDPRTADGCAVWTRRGEVLVVQAPANTPAVHAAWLEALALGYRVAVRPSRREPFTPHRLVAALRQAGFANDQVMLLPTDHPTADQLIAEADVAIAFGGDQVVRKYGSDTLVLPQGPGRSKILLTAGVRPNLDTIAESVAGQAGTGCINATAVFVDGDPESVARELARRFAALPSLPPGDERACLPVTDLAAAKRIDEYLRAKAGAARALHGDTIVHDLGDGSAVLRPAVFLLDRADAPQTRIELGFPCVWVAPWSPADGVAPLRDTLSLNAVTEDRDLIATLIADPTISKVFVGDHPTTWNRPDLPHEGYLGEFLMHSKAVIVG